MNDRQLPTKAAATLVALLIAFGGIPFTPAFAAERVALVIGNADYVQAPLRNPVNDARAIAAKLAKLGFDVMRLENAGRDEMEQAIIEYTERLGENTSGLFYFAGHGVQVNGHNYLIPVDAKVGTEREVRIEALDIDLVLRELEHAGNRLNIVILDACRNNPFERRFRGRSRGLAAVDAARGTLIAYATAPGDVALDGDGNNGVYTEELLRALDRPGLGVEEVFKEVRINVAMRTDDMQIPWESSSLTGEFVFRPGASGTARIPLERDAELVFWESVRGSGNSDAYRAYLERYPEGVFASLARIELARLDREDDSVAASRPATAAAAETLQAGDSSTPQVVASVRKPDSTPAGEASGPARIVLLPPNTRNLCGECDSRGEVSSVAGGFFRERPDLELTHTYQGARLGAAELPYSSDYWKGSYTVKTPNEDVVYGVGDTTNADAALMYVYQSVLMKGAWDGGVGRVRVYLFDLRARTVHEREGTRFDMRKNTEEVVEDYLRSR